MRPCPRCGARVSGFAERCPDCGEPLPLAMPWWGWMLGGMLVLMLFLALSDFRTLFEVFGADAHFLPAGYERPAS